MGTTLTMAYVIWPNAYIVHVGDSRCYLLRGDCLEQLTKDHTAAQKLAEKGALEKLGHKEANRLGHILWNALGGPDDFLSPEVYRTRLELGDTLLLATDGLTRHLTDSEILDKLKTKKSAKETASLLVKATNDAGGSDNVTVVIARFVKAQADTDANLTGVTSERMTLPPEAQAPTREEAFLKNLEAQILEWNSAIASLKPASEQDNKKIDKLEENLKAAQALRDEILSIKELGTWDSLKERVEKTWSSLRETFSATLSNPEVTDQSQEATLYHIGSHDEIQWTFPEQFTVPLEMNSIYDVHGTIEPVPHVGDHLKAEFVKSWIVFEFIEVNLCEESDKNFRAKVRPLRQQGKS